MYWLISQSTIRGQEPRQVADFGKCWAKYNDLIKYLTLQNPKKRLCCKEEIERFLERNELSERQFKQEYRIIKSNEFFNEILRKNFPGWRNLFRINDYLEIQNLFNDLNESLDATHLYYRFYHLTGGDFYVRRIREI